MSPEAKLRTLAQQDAALVARLGTTPFRWFDQQLPQFPNGAYLQYVNAGPCVRVRRISNFFLYTQDGLNSEDMPLFQFDVLDLDHQVAMDALQEIIMFLGTIDLSTTDQFQCPPVTPSRRPVQVLSSRAGLEPVPDPPIFVESIDVRFINLQ